MRAAAWERFLWNGWVIPMVGALGLLVGCAGDVHPCNDGEDNDLDGLIDDIDPGCEANGTSEEPDPRACGNGADDDGDGRIDLTDPDCSGPEDDDESKAPPACSDGLDNDGDGWFDHPNDPGCFLPIEETEEDDCPDGPGCPACKNGVDDDLDGLIDYPQEPGCTQGADNDEFHVDPRLCGMAVPVAELPGPSDFLINLGAGSSSELVSATCGGDGHEVVLLLRIPVPVTLHARTDFNETNLDTVLSLRTTCADGATEVVCNDNATGAPGPDSTLGSELLLEVEPGLYYLIVDSTSQVAQGTIRLSVSYYSRVGDQCNPSFPVCPPGHLCQPVGGPDAAPVCVPPQCKDGLDNDGDGLIDQSQDPGCDSDVDNQETDDCPDGPGCPACSNGRDDDFDGQTDRGQDPGCEGPLDLNEFDDCIPGVPVILLTNEGDTGTTPPLGTGRSRFHGSCDLSADPTENVYGYSLARTGLSSLRFSIVDALQDTVTYVRYRSCDDEAAELVCIDSPRDTVETAAILNPQPGPYYVFVDGDDASNFLYELEVSGTIAPGEACEPEDTRFVCEPEFACDPVTYTCQAAACKNGVDDDGDGTIDVGQDPGCLSGSDNDESDDCPDGPTCPRCVNQTDDDGDGKSDLGVDPGCTSIIDDNEFDDCIAGVPTLLLTDAGASGTTPPGGSGRNRFRASCGGASNTPTEDVYGYFLDRADLASLTFSALALTNTMVLSVRSPSCGDQAAELGCSTMAKDKTSSVSLASPQPGAYYVFLDGLTQSALGYELTVSGTIAPGGACDAADARFVCVPGHVCDAVSSTCELARCNDGADDDGDGLADYPADPGCVTVNDDDEADGCPGPDCPACANGADDDGDGASDHPADLGCTAASDSDEAQASEDECTRERDPLERVVAAITRSTTRFASDDFVLSCQSGGAQSLDRVFVLSVPGFLQSLTVDTVGSSFNTLLGIKPLACDGPELGCNDNISSTVTQSRIILGAVAPGAYAIVVDGAASANGNVQLNVHGVIAPYEPCDPALVAAGVLSCTSDFACDGSVCIPSQCNNGVDDDSDGLADFPADPGCTAAQDALESDTCPAGPGCPACKNGVDDDFDGLTDFPADADCSAASEDNEVADCKPGVATRLLTNAGAAGTTPPAGTASQFAGSCNASLSPEHVYSYHLLRDDLVELAFSTAASAEDTVLYVRRNGCNTPAAEVACVNAVPGGETAVLADPVPGAYFVFVDGNFLSSVDYQLEVSGVIGPGGACEPGNTQFVCLAGHACDAVASTCVPTACMNRIDDDGDGLVDFPAEPGCTSESDDDELDGCPGPGCPACGNGADDDGDGAADYPADPGCAFAADGHEQSCALERDAVVVVTAPVTTGSTAGLANDLAPSCASVSTAPEQVLELPVVGLLSSLIIDTSGSLFDTVLSLKTPTCGDADLACDMNGGAGSASRLVVEDVEPGSYLIVVDGAGSAAGAFVVDVRGVIAPFQPCEPALDAAGVLVCPAGYLCEDRICTPAPALMLLTPR